MGDESDVAVSPVIGVVLMVAITVILAAVIATFVFGMATNIPVTRTLAVTADASDADHIVIIYKGGPDAASFSYGSVSIRTSTGALVTQYSNATVSPPGGPTGNILGSNVGSMVTATAGSLHGFIGKDNVIVTGRFKDGTSQVIFNTYI